MATSDGIAGAQQYEKWYDLFQKNCLKGEGEKNESKLGILQRI